METFNSAIVDFLMGSILPPFNYKHTFHIPNSRVIINKPDCRIYQASSTRDSKMQATDFNLLRTWNLNYRHGSDVRIRNLSGSITRRDAIR